MLPFLVEERPTTLTITPLGRVRTREIAAVRSALVRTFRLEVAVGPRRALPRETYYPPRGRYRADHLIDWLAKGGAGDKVLGVAAVDVSTTARGHRDWGVVGLGQLGGRSAVVSSYRLKGDLTKLSEVAVHEAGHTLGLPHCPNRGCTMQDANGKVRRIGARFCGACRKRIGIWLR